MNHKFAIFFLIFCWGVLPPAYGDVTLPTLISDGMVLQREVPLNIWGWADPRERLTLTFAGNTYRLRADRQGNWQIRVPAMKAGGPHVMEITGHNKIVIRDILIGDVWFCSGQSNMVLPMERVKEKYPDAIANAQYPHIRNFFVPTAADITAPRPDLPPGQWTAITPQTVLPMGAVTFFFARQLYERYGVPIGIINSSVGGTPAQAWISGAGLETVQPYASRLARLQDSIRRATPESGHRHTEDAAPPAPEDKGLTGPIPWFHPDYQPKGWRRFWMPGYWDDQGTRNLHGILWFRREVDIPAPMVGRPAKLFLGRIIDADETYFNGVRVGNITYQYPPRRYEVPAGLLKPGRNTIVVRVTNTGGKGGFVPDKQYSLTIDRDTIDLRGDWTYQVGYVQPPQPEPASNRPTPFVPQSEPSGLYNTMVAPAVNYAIKGFLWYQGETNTGNPGDYATLMGALIKDWRQQWGMGPLPFIYAQLANFMEVDFSPAESNWAALREQQLQTLAIPNTAMAVTIDLGEWNDIHPLNKRDVGERMALAARHLAYGDTTVVHSGPIFESATLKNDSIELAFLHIGSGLTIGKGEELCHFAIAGEDKHFIWANARIRGDRVVVWHDDIKEPRYVRYAWADNPDCANLYNKEGLPASPFRTDR